MTQIGDQDGIHASIERLRKLDPGGTKPSRNPNDLATWGAWDKLERTLQILKDDHDARSQQGGGATLSVPFPGGSSLGTPPVTAPSMGIPMDIPAESKTSSTIESSLPDTEPSQSSTENSEETSG